MPNICGKNYGPGKKIPSYNTNCCGEEFKNEGPGPPREDLKQTTNQNCLKYKIVTSSSGPITFNYTNCAGKNVSYSIPFNPNYNFLVEGYRNIIVCGRNLTSNDARLGINVISIC